MVKRKRKKRDKVKHVMLNYGHFDPDIPVNDFFELHHRTHLFC